MRAAIDTSIFIYKYKYISGDKFIFDFLEQINRLLINNNEPVYIFDGAPPVEKKDTIKSRKERKENYQNKINLLKTELDTLKTQSQQTHIEQNISKEEIEKKESLLIEEINKIQKKTISVTSDDISD